jgi:hypothetical protein
MSAAPGGLASYGEVERLSEVQSQHYSELHTADDDEDRPICPALMVEYEDRHLGTVSKLRADVEVPRYSDAASRRAT